MFKHLMVISCLTALAACASIIEGSSQRIAIQTSPNMPASCHVQNERGSWGQPNTPSTVNVKRSKSDLLVACESPTHQGQFTKRSSLEPWTLGNILLGGIIGAGVDAGTGAMFTYDDQLTVPMTPKSGMGDMNGSSFAPMTDSADTQSGYQQQQPSSDLTPQSNRGTSGQMIIPPSQFY